jgi:hypothetical protein
MPRNSDTVKAANFHQTKFKAKVIEWEPREHSRGIRDVPVEVIDMASRPKPRKKASRRPRAEDNAALQGEAAPQPMDINETFWVDLEEPVIPMSKKRVRQPACPSSTKLTWHMSPSPRTLTVLYAHLGYYGHLGETKFFGQQTSIWPRTFR